MSTFNSLLQQEISKKRKAGEGGVGGAKKYRRKGEINEEALKKQREAEEEEERKRLLERQKELEEEQKRKLEEERAQQQTLTAEEEKLMQIPLHQIITSLRALKEPIILFGEGHLERAKRLRRLERLRENDTDGGQRHELQEILATIEEETEEGELKKKKKAEPDWATMVPTCDEETALFWLKKTLHEWEEELDSRPEEEKRKPQGKQKTAMYYQTHQHMKPLMRQLRKRTITPDLLKPIMRIVENCKKREYVAANDAYLEMAIGNAPWPIGVTMVGIHERSAREKIFSNQVAHVLNDEVQRKYIQGMKRMMTFCQDHYPTVPSKCVR